MNRAIRRATVGPKIPELCVGAPRPGVPGRATVTAGPCSGREIRTIKTTALIAGMCIVSAVTGGARPNR